VIDGEFLLAARANDVLEIFCLVYYIKIGFEVGTAIGAI